MNVTSNVTSTTATTAANLKVGDVIVTRHPDATHLERVVSLMPNGASKNGAHVVGIIVDSIGIYPDGDIRRTVAPAWFGSATTLHIVRTP